MCIFAKPLRVAFITFVLCCFSFGFAFGAELTDNYEPVYEINNGIMYVDTASVTVDEYNPPFYQISAHTLFVAANDVQTHRRVTFRYNRTKQTIYLKGTDDKWYWLDPNAGEIAAKEIDLAAHLFFLCYEEPFDEGT